jgi:hypothetical protein
LRMVEDLKILATWPAFLEQVAGGPFLLQAGAERQGSDLVRARGPVVGGGN